MSKLLKLEEELKEAKSILEKAMYKPAAPYKKPTSTTVTAKKTEFKVVPLGKRTFEHDGSHEHGYEVYHNDKSIGTGSVQKQPSGKYTTDLSHDDSVDKDLASKAIDHVEAKHKKANPDHEFEKSLTKRGPVHKLLKLEEELKKAKEELEKFGSQGAPLGSNLGSSIASGLGGGQPNTSKKESEHEDEEEDKEMIADALDQHNEKKHGEKKSKNSAQKDMGLKKKELMKSLPNGQWSLGEA
jgi:hypothetical protein